MAHGESNCHVTDDVTWREMAKVVLTYLLAIHEIRDYNHHVNMVEILKMRLRITNELRVCLGYVSVTMFTN